MKSRVRTLRVQGLGVSVMLQCNAYLLLEKQLLCMWYNFNKNVFEIADRLLHVLSLVLNNGYLHYSNSVYIFVSCFSENAYLNVTVAF